MSQPSRIFVSPHSDDIVYSCYNSVVHPPAPVLNPYLILTIFGVSKRAAGLVGQRTQEQITRVRKSEDEAFARSEGCQLVSLNFPDSDSRGEANEGLKTTVEHSYKHDIFKDVRSAIEKIIRPAIGKACIYIPLGIRGHIDHRISRDAVRDIISQSNIPGAFSTLIYYEDLPYATFATEQHIKTLARSLISPMPKSYDMTLRGLWAKKRKAIGIYASQSTPEVLKAIEEYASSISDSGLPEIERLWLQDNSRVPPVVDIMAWVTWEAARRVGGYTTLLKHIFASTKFQSVVGRTILMGPMHMPLVCPEYRPLEDVQSIASTLDCHILYPMAMSTIPFGLSKHTQALLNEIEKRHDIGIFYLRDKDQEYHVDRILFNFSRVLDHENIYMKSLPPLLTDLKHHINLSVDVKFNRRPAILEVLSNAKEWTGFDPYDNTRQNLWKKNRCDVDPLFYAHKDSDSIYGLLLALPVSECLRAIAQADESAVLIATEELSLPAVYATQIARVKYSEGHNPNIKTLFYSGDVHPVRNLTTGAVSPKVTNLAAVSGFDFEGPIRSIIKLSHECAKIDGNGIPVFDRHFLDFEPLKAIASHTNMRIVQQGWRADAVAATSASVRDELVFLNRAFALKGEMPIISPGVSGIPCEEKDKEISRQKLISYARYIWGFEDLNSEDTIIASQIARAVAPKGFIRAVRLLQILAGLIRDSGRSTKILFIIITGWDSQRTNVGDYRIIDELQHELGGTTLSSENLRVKVVNQPQWPLVSEINQIETGLTREDLHRATDVSLCLSLYDTFAIAPLEPMSCGSIAVVSTGCGCYHKVYEIDGWQDNIIVGNYAEEWVENILKTNGGQIPQTLDSLFEITREEKKHLEVRMHQRLSTQLMELLPWSSAERVRKIASGRRIAQALNWEDQFSRPFEVLLKELFPISVA